MEPLDLTCAKCNGTWKLIKAEGTITCPYCKVIVDSPPLASSSETTVPAPVPSESPVTAEKPPEPGATNEPAQAEPDPVATPATDSIPLLARLDRPSAVMDDADDPGPRADYDDRRRSGMHPLLKVFIILMILFILVPLAIVILIAVVCAVMLSGR